MTTPTNGNKTDGTKVTSEESQKRITAHKQTATHLQAAAQHHLDAAKHHETNSHEKATKSNLEAQATLTLANEAQKESTKHYASDIRK